MFPNTDLHEQEQDASNDAPTRSPQGQSEDWESRFKGLQREYNKLKNSLAGKEGHATQLQREINDLKQQLQDIAQSSEGQITMLSTEKESLAQQLQAIQQQYEEASSRAARLERQAEVRRTITQQFRDQAAFLLEAYDTGYLDIGDRQGEDLRQFVQGYLDFHGKRVEQTVNHTLRGSSPPSLSQGDGSKLDEKQLEDWLMTHDESHPDYNTIRNAWLNASASG